MINRMNKVSTLKTLVSTTCDSCVHNHRRLPKVLPSFTHKSWFKRWYCFQALSQVAARCDRIYQTNNIKSSCDKSTMVRSKTRAHGQIANKHVPYISHKKIGSRLKTRLIFSFRANVFYHILRLYQEDHI